ncbi:MAG: hypothetical protein WAX04_04130 [Oscillospiraceae bacterium]
MNLITCDENCKYQNEGYCQLNQNAVINGLKVNGCSYFIKRKPLKKKQKSADGN